MGRRLERHEPVRDAHLGPVNGSDSVLPGATHDQDSVLQGALVWTRFYRGRTMIARAWSESGLGFTGGGP